MSQEQLSVATLLDSETPVGKPIVPWAEEAPLDWQLDPGTYTDAEAIHVNVAATRRLLRVAGFSGLTVRHYIARDTRPEQEINISGISGVSGDGSAVATGTSLQHIKPKVESSKLHKTDLERHLPLDFTWPRLTVEVDRQTMGETISSLRSKHRSLSREKAWALTIDDAVKAGIKQGAKEHLMPSRNSLDKITNFISGYWLFNVASSMALLLQDIQSGEFNYGNTSSATFYALTIALFLGGNKIEHGRTFFERKRHSTSPLEGQVDRYLATIALAASQKLVRAK